MGGRHVRRRAGRHVGISQRGGENRRVGGGQGWSAATAFTLTMSVFGFAVGGAAFGVEDIAVSTAREVRSVYTAELGVATPQGIVYAGGELLVSSGSTVTRLGFDEDLLGEFTMTGAVNGRSLAFDPTGETLLMSGPDGDVVKRLGPDWRSSPGSGTSGPRAFHPETGAEYRISGDRLAVRSQGVTRLTRLGNLDGARLFGIAFSATDLYVASATDLYLLEPDGRYRTAYRFERALDGPSAMTFAPSSDPTDDPAVNNLFVVESGAVTEFTLLQATTLAVATDTGTLVQTIATSAFVPASPDPAGVTYLPYLDRLEIADSEVDEVTGAGYHGVNLWTITRTGTVTDTGTLYPTYSKEPTGLGFDDAGRRLFVSDDSAKRVWVVRPGLDERWGTGDDQVSYIPAGSYGSTDTEDPAFDPATGHVFFLDGIGMEIYRVDPVDGVFGNGNDVMSHFDISGYGPTDFEGLALNPKTGTLFLGARRDKKVYEITGTGTLLRVIDVSATVGMRFISGLTIAPASDGSGADHIWIVDRAVDNGSDATENDGRLFEFAAPMSGNAFPVATDDSAATAEDTPVGVDVLANDYDPDGILDVTSVAVVSGPASGSATVQPDGSITYVPAPDFAGTDGFTYRVCDDGAACATAAVSITVTPVNDAPVAADDSATTAGTIPVTIEVLANDTDVDGSLDPGSLAVVTPPSTGTATVQSGTIVYTPAGTGVYTFTYAVCDDAALCDTAIVTVTVLPPNDPPTATDDSAGVAEDGVVDVAVTANDTDPEGSLDPASLVIVSGPAAGTALVVGDLVRYRPVADFFGSDSLVYEICDTVPLCDQATVSITVTPVNDPPVAVDDQATTEKGVAVTIPVLSNDTDIDSTLTTVTIITAPGNGTATVETGSVSYVPAAGFTGVDTFIYQVCDDAAACDSATVQVTVNAIPVTILGTPTLALGDFEDATITTGEHLLVAGDSRQVVIFVAYEDKGVTGPQVTSVTYGGVAASPVSDGTDVARAVAVKNNTNGMEVWAIPESALPANGGHTTTVTWNVPVSVRQVVVLAVQNTSQGAADVALRSTTSATKIVGITVSTPVVGSLVLDGFAHSLDSRSTPTGGQTELWDYGGPVGSAGSVGSAKSVSGAGSTAMTHRLDRKTLRIAHIVVVFDPV